MTDKEIKVLAAFIDEHKIVAEKSPYVNPFHPTVKRKVAEKLNHSDYNTLNNYIKSLKDKGLIKPTSTGYRFHPVVLPKSFIRFEFNETV